MQTFDVIIIGGGAAGIFSAVQAKAFSPEATVLVIEKTAVVLAKVKVSGGGRCNVTHSCFDPRALSQNYPRGHKELIGPFHGFQPSDTIAWFEERGIALKTEEDGRIFPTTDSSQTIINCLLTEARDLGVEIRLRQKISDVKRIDSQFHLTTQDGTILVAKKLILATGSSPDGHRWAEELGHTIQSPVPSLFTFNVPSSPLTHLSGIAQNPVELQIAQTSFKQTGPLLITHFGFSGPAAIKLSAWGARLLHEKQYRVELLINWLPNLTREEITAKILKLKAQYPQKILLGENLFYLPKNLWKAFLDRCNVGERRLNDISSQAVQQLTNLLNRDSFAVEGKTTHKEEFVTCGGVDLKEVDFKTMQSKICPGLFFAGEILDIDGVTGGFNFQNAWTTGFLSGRSKV